MKEALLLSPEALQALKDATALAHSNLQLSVWLLISNDAFSHALSTVPQQGAYGGERLIVLYSQKLSSAQGDYCVFGLLSIFVTRWKGRESLF
ncbi:hypothetical protein AHF37_09882 [Paragonimus kellicotti]|nr:hypothetical protein AHF37_09882 [Paragonimus kellicotti]